MWRRRQWRKLLNLIDHLPRNTYFSQAISQDEEHARMLLEAEKAAERAGKPKEKYAPPMSAWSQEADLLATVIDEVRGLRYITLAVNSKNKSSPPMPYPRPRTAIERVRDRQRAANHESLVARVLPHKRK